ncbi:MAG: N-acetylmuramoyl-L-alanine amidase [Magnetospirillum sp. WYHS-4]
MTLSRMAFRFDLLARRMAAALGLLSGLLAGGSVHAGTAVVTDLRVADHAASTRVVLDITQPIAFSVFTLAAPYRVVIDMPEVGWRLPPRPLPQDAGLLHQLRYGRFQQGVTRLVLDTKGPTTVNRAAMLEPDGDSGYRLVVDLGTTSHEAFVRGLKQPEKKVVATTRPGETDRTAKAERKAPAPTREVQDDKPEAIPVATGARKPAAGNLRQEAAVPRAPAKPESKGRAPAKHVIAIDAGHGGADPGTVGVSGIYEKHITLSMARELKTALERTGRFQVVLTRERDVFIRLRKRVEIARKAGAELFISLHADAIAANGIRGLSVYTLSEKASDKEAAMLAEKENKADLIPGINLDDEPPEVANILIDLTQRETMNQSAHLAGRLVGELQRDVTTLPNAHRFAGFAVLKAPDIPSVLVELGFLSHKQEEKALRGKEHRDRIATAIARAVQRYFTQVEEANRM